jgi:predicted phosphodiesterase
VISDIHANIEAYNTVIAHINENFPDVTEILCPGDLTGYGPAPMETIEAVLLDERIKAITKGNHDHGIGSIGGGGQDSSNVETYLANFNPYAQYAIRWHADIISTELKTFLYQLPHTRNYIHQTFSEIQIAIIHGSPSFPLDEYILPGTKAQKDLFPFMELFEINVLLLGHTHIPFIDIKKDEKNLLILNPGSIGQPRDKDSRASYAVIDLENFSAEIIRVEYDIDLVAKQIKKVGLPDFLSERLRKGI